MAEKIKKIVSKYDNIFLIFLIFILLVGIDFNLKMSSNSDELWNFSNIYKMYNGYEIYKDINVIITPLFFYIGYILFKIFTANFFVFRIYNLIIAICTCLIIYNIFKAVKFSKISSLLYTLITFLLTKYIIITVAANYNILAIMFFLLGILINIKNKQNFFINGILIFLIFMSKQNIGIYYIIGMILNLIFVEKLNKKTITEFIKSIIVFFCMFLVYCIYLYFRGSLFDFISYCFLGISEFGEKNVRIQIYPFVILIFLIFSIILLKKLIKNKIETDSLKMLNKIEYYVLPMLLISYPIFNDSHVYMSIIGIGIELIIILDLIFLKEILSKKALYILVIILISVMSLESILYFISWYNNKNQYKEYVAYEPYFGTILKEDINNNNIEKVIEYIKNNNKKTIVFGYKASLYNIALKTNNGAMDLPFYGNFGKDGEQGMLNQIKELKNTNILIEKDEKDMMWQESKTIRKYIQDNLKCVGEIENFLIYESE